jgi:hypothetical protein
MPAYFIHAEGRLPGGLPPPIHITHFEFNAKCQGLTFEAATEVEMQLLAKLLKAGGKGQRLSWNSSTGYEDTSRQAIFAEDLDRNAGLHLAEKQARGGMELLRLETETEANKRSEEEEPYKDNSSSKHSSSHSDLTPQKTSFPSVDNSPVDPSPSSASHIEMRRRFSEPQIYTGSLGAGLDISPLRGTTASRAIPIKDPKTKMHRSPTKGGKRASFAVDDTIHEESETEAS